MQSDRGERPVGLLCNARCIFGIGVFDKSPLKAIRPRPPPRPSAGKPRLDRRPCRGLPWGMFANMAKGCLRQIGDDALLRLKEEMNNENVHT
jgi:hypothetical protein